MSKTIRKTYQSAVTKEADEDRTLIVRISTNKPDRSNDIVRPEGADLTNYKRNPVVALNHNYQGLAIAKTEELKITDDGIMAKVRFPKKGVHDLSDTVFELYKEGFMNAWSIGFIPKKFDPIDNGGKDFKEWELLEYSAVLVPDNPEALTMLRSKGYEVDDKGKILTKGAIAYKGHPTASEDTEWNGSEEIAKSDTDDLLIMSTWFDEESPDAKASYKLPHHRQSDKWTVLRGVNAAMASLLGARGGVDIPEADRRGVYDHLARHIKEYDREAPEFRSYKESAKKLEAMLNEVKAKKPAEVKALDSDIRLQIQHTLTALKAMQFQFEKLLDAQPKEPNKETKKVINLVEGLKLADKTIGIALRNYKSKQG